MEGTFAVLYYLTCFPLVGAIWALTPVKQSARDALLALKDNGTGWSPSFAVLIGQITAMDTIVGSDAAAHMAEEIREAGMEAPAVNQIEVCLIARIFSTQLTCCTASPPLPAKADCRLLHATQHCRPGLHSAYPWTV